MPLGLTLLSDLLAVCRLPAAEPVPEWAWSGALCSVTRTADELSVVCSWGAAPEGVKREGPWRAFQVDGPLDFALCGVLHGILTPLKDAGIPVFVLSTYDTDYVLVSDGRSIDALSALQTADYNTQEAP